MVSLPRAVRLSSGPAMAAGIGASGGGIRLALAALTFAAGCMLVLVVADPVVNRGLVRAAFVAGIVVSIVALGVWRGNSERSPTFRRLEIGDALARESVVRGSGRVVADPITQQRRSLLRLRLEEVAEVSDFGGARVVVTAPAAGRFLSGSTPLEQAVSAQQPALGSLVYFEGGFQLSTSRVRADQRVLGEIRARHWSVVAAPPKIVAASTALREHLKKGASRLPAEEAGLLIGLIYGDTSSTSPELRAKFTASGLSHLTAVSGQNFTLFLGGLSFLLSRFRRIAISMKTMTVVLGGAGLFFMLVTRFEPSVMRAGAMALLILAARMSGADVGFFEVVSLAIAGALLADPLLAYSLGFQLSLAATCGIAAWAPTMSNFLTERLKLNRLVALPASVALAAEIWVAPILLWRLGSAQTLSVPANLLAVPVAGVVSLWGLAVSAIAGFFPWLGTVLHVPTQPMLTWIIMVARAFGQVEWASFESSRLPGWLVGVAYACFAVAGAVAVRGRMARCGVLTPRQGIIAR